MFFGFPPLENVTEKYVTYKLLTSKYNHLIDIFLFKKYAIRQ